MYLTVYSLGLYIITSVVPEDCRMLGESNRVEYSL
jgi:hypothetical protein